MTCLEKFLKDHPEYEHRPETVINDFCPNGETSGIDIPDPDYCEFDDTACAKCWSRECPVPEPTTPTIKDSGTRQEFPTGAVRDIQKGKGRCDLLPLDVVSDFYMLKCGRGNSHHMVFGCLYMFVETSDCIHLQTAVDIAANAMFHDSATMLLEVSMHFEEGAEKYGENNWQKGLPVKCYINSAVRHYLKWLRGDTDERHDRAFCWNILCAIWTCKHKPELNEYGQKVCPVCSTVIPDHDNECPNCRVFTGTPDFLCELEEEYA